MTRQKDPTERRKEILAAALGVLDEQGLPGFTMEAVIARTPLSKGGVYRFYSNRHELMADVFRHIAEAFMPVELDAALAWALPLRETLHRLIFSSFHQEEGLKLRRIHLQLMPQLPQEEALLRQARQTFDAILPRYRAVILAIVRRDGMTMKPGFEATLASVIGVGQSLFDGLIMNNLGGLPMDEVERRMGAFVDLVTQATVEA